MCSLFHPLSIEEVLESDEIFVEEKTEVGGEDGGGKIPCVHEQQDGAVEEEAAKDCRTLPGEGAEEREAFPQRFRDEEGHPESVEGEDGEIDEWCEWRDEVDNPQWQADKRGMVESGSDRCPLQPHVSEEFEPEGRSVEDNELPQKKAVRPDGHP